MNKVAFIRRDGADYAVIPKAEYEQLVALAETAREDRGTRKLVRQARRDLAAGKESVIPKEAVDRLAKGENGVRVLREARNLTQVKLCASVRIGQGYLSDIETGRRRGPVDLYQRIARALNVPVDLVLPRE